jgi:hypothetical protein
MIRVLIRYGFGSGFNLDSGLDLVWVRIRIGGEGLDPDLDPDSNESGSTTLVLSMSGRGANEQWTRLTVRICRLSGSGGAAAGGVGREGECSNGGAGGVGRGEEVF